MTAQQQGVADANRMSFIDALRWLRSLLVVAKSSMPPLMSAIGGASKSLEGASIPKTIQAVCSPTSKGTSLT
jgi:hypothetical protein